MHLMTSQQSADIVSAFDFPSSRRLVDVGGGHGALTAAVLAAHPHVAVILFDSPEVTAGAQSNLMA